MLEHMRQIHVRLLVAQGYYLGKALSAPGLRIYQAQDQLSSDFLLFRGKTLGPSWPTIAKLLDESQIEYSLVEAGKLWLVVSDTERIRQVFSSLSKRVKQSASEDVLVPEVGFVSAGRKGQFELRNLLGPFCIGLASLGLFLVPALFPEKKTEEQPLQAEISCALDLSPDEIRDWVAASLEERELVSSAEVLVQSALGVLNLKFEQTLGSTQSVIGKIECKDGRSKPLHYRLDASANGGLVELGQELNP